MNRFQSVGEHRVSMLMGLPVVSFLACAGVKTTSVFFRSHLCVLASAVIQTGAPIARNPWGSRTVTNYLLDFLSLGLVVYGMKYTNFSFRVKCIVGMVLFGKQVSIANVRHETIHTLSNKGEVYYYLNKISEENGKEYPEEGIKVCTKLFQKQMEKKKESHTTQGDYPNIKRKIIASFGTYEDGKYVVNSDGFYIKDLLDIRLNLIKHLNEDKRYLTFCRHMAVVDRAKAHHSAMFEDLSFLSQEMGEAFNILPSLPERKMRWKILDAIQSSCTCRKDKEAMLQVLDGIKEYKGSLEEKLSLYKFFCQRYKDEYRAVILQNKWVKFIGFCMDELKLWQEKSSGEEKAKIFTTRLEILDGFQIRLSEKNNASLQEQIKSFDPEALEYWTEWKIKNTSLLKQMGYIDPTS